MLCLLTSIQLIQLKSILLRRIIVITKKLKKGIFCQICVILLLIFAVSVAFSADRPLRMNCAWPIRIDPHASNDASTSIASINVYDALVFSDSDGEPVGHVAEKWEVSKDGLIWTFHIRQGIKFHDGSELTANDVKFSMDRLLAMGKGNAIVFANEEIQTEVLDKYTIVFHLNSPDGALLQKLVFVYVLNEDLIRSNIKEPGLYGEMGDYGEAYLQMHDAGSGPYMVKEVVFESHVDMVINPNYWLPFDPNAPDEFKMIGTKETVTIRALLAQRELEIADEYQTNETYKSFEEIEGIKVINYEQPYLVNIMLNTKKPPTDDIHFRKAMAWAMDYGAVVDHIYPGCPQARGPIPQILNSHDPTVFQYHRDLDKAMEELKKSKYYGQLDKYPIEVHVIEASPAHEQCGILFMSNMADIGIDVKVVITPWLTYLDENKTIETTPNCSIAQSPVYYAEAGGIFDYKYSSYGAGLGYQVEWLLDDKFDTMFNDTIQTMDREERYAKYGKLQHYIVDLCPTIFLVYKNNMRPYQSEYVYYYVADKKFSPVKGFDFIVRDMRIYPEKRQKLLNK